MTFFNEEKCCQCGEPFGLAAETQQLFRRSGQWFYCPLGHQQHYTKTPVESETDAARAEADRMRRERDRLKQQLAERDDRVREERARAEAAERRASAARGQITRLKNRAAAGLCPCCNRSFVNLQRHMSTKHAGFTAESVQSEHGTIQ